MADEIAYPKYADKDPDRVTINGEPESAEARAERKRTEAEEAAAQERLSKKLVADPNSTEGTESFAPGFSPEELADPVGAVSEIARIEDELGLRFGDPDGEAANTPKPTLSLICRNPECSMSGEHVAVHHDTIEPIRCGGLVTTAEGTTRPCSAVLKCTHTTETTEQTTGTLGEPTRVITDRCTKCGSITAQTTEALPPIDLATLPVEVVDALKAHPPADADASPA